MLPLLTYSQLGMFQSVQISSFKAVPPGKACSYTLHKRRLNLPELPKLPLSPFNSLLHVLAHPGGQDF